MRNSQNLMVRTTYPSLFVALLLLIIAIRAAESRSLFGRRMAAAAIFGKSNQGEEKNDEGSTSKPLAKPPPPPPPTTKKQKGPITTNPPPPPPKPVSNSQPKLEEDETAQLTPELQTEPAVGREWTSLGLDKNNPQDPVAQNSWSQEDHQGTGTWESNTQYAQHNQQHYYAGVDAFHHQPWPSWEQQLADSAAREYDLAGQIQNLTDSISSMQQLDQIHVRQMDVLTERIMDAEAQLAKEHNCVLEYQSNCTERGLEIAALHQELSDWQSRCATFADQHAKNEAKIKELKKNLDEARAEAENLAISIENSRIRDQMDDSRRKKKKSRGFFGWVFSFLWSSEPEDAFDDQQSPRELAKSTLLRALQLERNNVDELEAIVASLQQNNSAIAEMVKSRDMIIDELNDRVAVFEEDKVVLKAALKQLQKEMKEEAPRTGKLVDDLEAARRENARLIDEVEALVEMHQSEINSLQQSIAEAQNAANASESNLTAIGTYVDTLEQRLASFAIVRRDVEMREQKCKEIEEQALQAEEERDNLRAKIEEFEVEQSDLKSLFEELVQEQTNMRQENARLKEERDSLTQGAQRSREALASLEVNMKKRDEDINDWKSKAQKLEDELNSTKVETSEMQSGLQAAQVGSEQLNKQIKEAQGLSAELRAELETKVAELSLAKEQLEAKTAELQQKEEAMSSITAKLRESQQEVDGILAKLQQREEELITQGVELTKLKEALAKRNDEAANASRLKVNTTIPPGQNRTASASRQEEAGQNRTRVLPPSHPRHAVGKKPPSLPPQKSQGPQGQTRKVPFRQVRKLFAKTTGVHGAFTRPSETVVLKKRPHSQPEVPKANQKAPRGGAKNRPPSQPGPPKTNQRAPRGYAQNKPQPPKEGPPGH